MAHPLKARPKSDIISETRLVLLSASERYAHLTQHELIRVEDRAKPIPSSEENIEAEFERKKQSIIKRSDPAIRVAAFLAAISRQNEREGRDATIVCDSVKCGAVAGLLDLNIDAVSRALATLQQKGLIESDNVNRLHLRNIIGLERFIDQKHQGPFRAAGRISPAPFLAQNSWWLIGELRELSWLLLSLVCLSIVCVGLSAIIAMAIFE